MEILIIYVFTLLSSSIIKFAYKMKVIKYLADVGYKLEDYYGFTKLKFVDFVLGINVINALKKLVKPNFGEIRTSDAVVKMTDDEVFGYKLNPDLIAALALNTRSDVNDADNTLKNIREKQLIINDDNSISYHMENGDKETKYVILSVQGELINSLDLREQISIIKEYYVYVRDAIKRHIDEFYNGDDTLFDEDVLAGEFDYVSFKEAISKEYGKNVEKRLKKK